MVSPLDSPLSSPIAAVPPSMSELQTLINTANQAATGTQATVQSAIAANLTVASKAVNLSSAAIASAIAANLKSATAVSDQVQNSLDTAILGQLGTVATIGSQLPGFQAPTVANLAAAFSAPAPPPPPPIPSTITANDQVFEPVSGPGSGEIVPIKLAENCMKIKWKLPDGTYGVFFWHPGITQPPQAPSAWEVYDGPKPCSANWIPELPPPVPPPPKPVPIIPPVLAPISLPPPDNLPVTVESNDGPCPRGITGAAPVYSRTTHYQGITVNVARWGASIWTGWCLPGYFAPYKQGSDWIVPVWGKASQKMYAALLAGDPSYTLQNHVILDYPEGKGSRAYTVQYNLKIGQVYAIELLDSDEPPGLPIGNPLPTGPGPGPVNPTPPISGGPTYPPTPTPPPPISGSPIINNPVGGVGGSPPTYGGSPPPISGNPIINNPIGGSPSPSPGGPAPSPPPPSPPPPTYPTPTPPTPTPPTYPTPTPPPTYPPISGAPIINNPIGGYPGQPSPPTYPPVSGNPIINNPIGGGGTLCPVPIVNVPAPIVNVTCPTPTQGGSSGGSGGGGGVGSPPVTPPPVTQHGPITTKSSPLPGGPWPSFCDVDFQKSIDGITQAIIGGGSFDLFMAIGARDAHGKSDPNSWFNRLLGNMPDALADGIVYVGDQISKMVNGEVQLGGSPVIAFLAPGLLRMLAQTIHHFTGVRLEGLEHKINYWFDYLSPDLMPESGEFNKMRMAGVISAKQWRAGVRANNRCESWQKLVMDADRERVEYHELWKLDKLGLVEGGISPSDIRSYGFRKLSDIADMQNAFRRYPSWEEAFEWGTKGVFDDAYAGSVGLDAGMADILGQQGVTYCAGEGVDQELLKYRWRAHWDLPSVEFTLDAFHRLRPGRVTPELAVPPEQIKQLLQANGVAPAYQDRLIELSRPRISRREMSVLFKMGALSKDEVVQRLRDIGYVEEFGKSISDAFQLQKVAQLSNMPESRAYVKGGMDALKLGPVLKQYGASAADQQLIFERLDREVAANAQEKIIESYHKRFLNGDIAAGLLVGTLSKAGVEVSSAQKMGEQWIAELQAKEKHVEAGQLVAWFEAGLISGDELATRLARLAYQPADVAGIVTMAEYKLSQTQSKAIMAKKKADDAAKAKIARQAEQEAKQTAAAIRASERLTNAVNKVTVELEIHEKISVDDARQMVVDAIAKYRALNNSTDAGATEFIKNAWAIHSKKGGPTWQAVVDDLIANLKAKANAKANQG